MSSLQNITDIAIGYDDTTIYVISDGQVYKSTDGGYNSALCTLPTPLVNLGVRNLGVRS